MWIHLLMDKAGIESGWMIIIAVEDGGKGLFLTHMIKSAHSDLILVLFSLNRYG